MDYKLSLDKIILQLREDLKTIRTGHANPAIVENLMVDAYGGQTKLKLMELSSITTDGPSVICIAAFDPSTVNDIEKAILKSPLGLSPRVQGTKILIAIPSLSQEQREKYVKLIGQKIEEKKVHIRNCRDEKRKKIKQLFENKELSEDEKFRQEKEIDTITQKYMTDIQSIKDNKVKEIMEV